MPDVNVRPLEVADRAAWNRLYAGYAQFYGVEQSGLMRDRVWGWIHQADRPVIGFGALIADQLIGLAHCRAYLRPLSATSGGFLDDLFVDPNARGTGAADALIAAVATEGRLRGWSVLRWITAEDNHRARKVYDRVATKTPWVTYDIKL
jgi:GNAT superfamily N-acetyltransferase